MPRALGWQVLLLLGLAFLPGITQAVYFRERVSWQSPVPASEMVTVEQAKAWGDNVLWLDARPNEQFAEAHYPAALPLNQEHWNEMLPPIFAAWKPEKRIVVYCGSESCGTSREVAQRLRDEAHWENVYVLTGGWDVLRASGK